MNIQLWKFIHADLSAARGTLPLDAAQHPAIVCCGEFLASNELELACDRLEDYAKDQPVSREFWLCLRNAANKMQLPDREERYEAFALRG